MLLDDCNCKLASPVACEKKCSQSCDPCYKKNCCSATFDCDFNVLPDVNDPRYWWFTIDGCSKRVKIPGADECCIPPIDVDCASQTLTIGTGDNAVHYTGKQLGCLLNLDDLADVNAPYADACSMLVRNPGCGGCPCDPEEDTWQPYVIPDAGDCVMEPDEDGYYHPLVKNDCGCIVECRMPVMPSGMTALNYVRDSVPDDPDFPWYYGCYNDRINLHLADNAPKYFGKYALKVTVNYGVQTIMSSQCKNVNFRSLVVPVIDGETTNVEKESSILQGNATASSNPPIPWSSQSLRGSFTFIVPKGKEAYLHHEWRFRSYESFPNYYLNPTYDGVRVPDEIASQVNALPWNASRLNALQVLVEPTQGASNYDPTVDPERQKLDDPVDEYPTL